MAEDKSNFGKIVKRAIREMWALEYEVDELQLKFSDSIGKMDLDNLDVDFHRGHDVESQAAADSSELHQ